MEEKIFQIDCNGSYWYSCHTVLNFNKIHLFLQMVQAIQVLRFHLLELEKVSNLMYVNFFFFF